MMDNEHLAEAIATQRRGLAEMLHDLPADAWDSQTLCAGWRVREVVAHVTMPFRYSTARFVREIARSRGNFDRMADRCARRDAQAPPGELLAALRDNERHPWKPPGGGLEAALSHDVIHGLDITIALDIAHHVPEDHLRMVLDTITAPQSLKHFHTDLDGIELRAEDMDWSFGRGAQIHGPAQELAMILCGRQLPAPRLHGEGAARFTAA
ncbi:MAG TPA: maleylpyruvate isomerase family mycothiol-dependent enzyme [Jatrophihabitans sp.]|jgi:uncharacterized protein (TIGR03083 family)